jgi:D-inositol-3-phosphate glycosyltransferase
MTRVAMVSYHTCPLASEEGKETGGMNVYVLELAKALGALGIQVDIFTRAQDPSNEPEIWISETVRLLHIPAGPMAGVPKHSLRQYLPEFVANIKAWLKKENPIYTVWHAHYYLSGLVVKELGAMPLLMQFHTLGLMKNLVARTLAEQETTDRIQAEYELVTQAQMILAPSEYERQYLEDLFMVPAAKIQVIPPGFNQELFHPLDQLVAKKHIGADLDHKLVMFVGRIEPLKGVDSIIYALKMLLKRHPDWSVCLWIVGGDIAVPPEQWSAEMQRLNQVCKNLHLSASVKFVGQQPQHELPYYYSAAEVVVMASHYESFGMAALEAMACGVPVITSNVTGISSLLDERHAELITTVNNPLLLATQLEKVLIRPNIHAQLASQLTTQVADLRWPIVAKQVLALYEKVGKITSEGEKNS